MEWVPRNRRILRLWDGRDVAHCGHDLRRRVRRDGGARPNVGEAERGFTEVRERVAA